MNGTDSPDVRRSVKFKYGEKVKKKDTGLITTNTASIRKANQPLHNVLSHTEEERRLTYGPGNLQLEDSPHAYIGPYSFREDNRDKMVDELARIDGDDVSDVSDSEEEHPSDMECLTNGGRAASKYKAMRSSSNENSDNSDDDDDSGDSDDSEPDSCAVRPKTPHKTPLKTPSKKHTPSKKASSKSSTTNGINTDLPFDPVENLIDFINRPVPPGYTVQCRVTRDRKGVDKGIHPAYFLHMERSDDKKVFLLAARKRKRSRTANYLISADPTDMSRSSDAFMAKVRSNFVGTQFSVYDNGLSPLVGSGGSGGGRRYAGPAAHRDGSSLVNPDLRNELATVLFETNVLGFKGPRRMTVVCPDVVPQTENGRNRGGHNNTNAAAGTLYRRVAFCPISDADSIIGRWKRGQTTDLIELRNKTPVWNEDTQSYVLNFHGRVTQASVKNFQLVRTNEVDTVVLQFGRIQDDIFTLDFAHPLCALQAFGVALSSFDSKLACE